MTVKDVIFSKINFKTQIKLKPVTQNGQTLYTNETNLKDAIPIFEVKPELKEFFMVVNLIRCAILQYFDSNHKIYNNVLLDMGITTMNTQPTKYIIVDDNINETIKNIIKPYAGFLYERQANDIQSAIKIYNDIVDMLNKIELKEGIISTTTASDMKVVNTFDKSFVDSTTNTNPTFNTFIINQSDLKKFHKLEFVDGFLKFKLSSQNGGAKKTNKKKGLQPTKATTPKSTKSKKATQSKKKNTSTRQTSTNKSSSKKQSASTKKKTPTTLE